VNHHNDSALAREGHQILRNINFSRRSIFPRFTAKRPPRLTNPRPWPLVCVFVCGVRAYVRAYVRACVCGRAMLEFPVRPQTRPQRNLSPVTNRRPSPFVCVGERESDRERECVCAWCVCVRSMISSHLTWTRVRVCVCMYACICMFMYICLCIYPYHIQRV